MLYNVKKLIHRITYTVDNLKKTAETLINKGFQLFHTGSKKARGDILSPEEHFKLFVKCSFVLQAVEIGTLKQPFY